MTNREKSYEKGCMRMSKELPVLKVRMLGRFSVNWGEKDIAFKRTTSTKALQLFQILLYTKETGIQRTRLLDYLYSRDELADMANNLRVTSHRLKKMLVDAGMPEYDYIQIKKGVYKWNSPMEVEVDALDCWNTTIQCCSQTVALRRHVFFERPLRQTRIFSDAFFSGANTQPPLSKLERTTNHRKSPAEIFCKFVILDN